MGSDETAITGLGNCAFYVTQASAQIITFLGLITLAVSRVGLQRQRPHRTAIDAAAWSLEPLPSNSWFNEPQW